MPETLRFSARPGHVFGAFALIFGAVGSVLLGYLLVVKLTGEDIGGRPMLITGVLFMVMAVQFLTTAVISELLARIYYESGRSDSRAYNLREALSDTDPGWKLP